MSDFPVVIMIAPQGEGAASRWMAKARRAAAIDLWDRLVQVARLEVVVDAPDPVDRAALEELGARLISPNKGTFHFGRRLSEICDDEGWSRLAYFGAASAPLLTKEQLEAILDQAQGTDGAAGLVNNLHSSDWLVLNDTRPLRELADRFPKDNMLGWVLAHEGNVDVRAMPPETAFRADLDTPADVLMIGGHPAAGQHLRMFAQAAESPLRTQIDELRGALRQAGNSLGVIGRASSRLWGRLEAEFPIWVRCFVEERGMVASGRLAEGTVRSLVAEAVESWGAKRFVALLGEITQAVIWDTRVWMAHRGPWPSDSDRWSADLGWLDQIRDPALMELAEAIVDAPVPIVTGGQGVVGGSMMAMLDSVESDEADYQPSR
jgi:hypothetical protein